MHVLLLEVKLRVHFAQCNYELFATKHLLLIEFAACDAIFTFAFAFVFLVFLLAVATVRGCRILAERTAMFTCVRQQNVC